MERLRAWAMTFAEEAYARLVAAQRVIPDEERRQMDADDARRAKNARIRRKYPKVY